MTHAINLLNSVSSKTLLASVSSLVLSLGLGAAAALADGTAPCNDGAGASSTECGTNSDTGAGGTFVTAVGVNAQATTTGSTALGFFALASGVDATALGRGAFANQQDSTAIGRSASATAVNATALGRSATASGMNSIALGQGSSAIHANAIALGRGVSTVRANQVVIGNSANTATIAGISSQASRAAQSGVTLLVTSDAAGNLATDGGATAAGIAANTASLASMDRLIEENTEGTAVAIALSDPDLFGGQTFAIKGNWGAFEGSNALGFSMKGLVSSNLFGNGERLTLSGGVSYGLSMNTIGGRVSTQIGF